MKINVKDDAGVKIHDFQLSDKIVEFLENLRLARAEKPADGPADAPAVPKESNSGEMIQRIILDVYKHNVQNRPDLASSTLRNKIKTAEDQIKADIAAELAEVEASVEKV